MSDREMSYQRHEEGTGDREALYKPAVGYAFPTVAMRATLIDSDMERIRQVMREELRQDWNEHIPFGEEMDEEEERKWQQTQQENDKRFMAELAQLVDASVRRALYGDPVHEDDLPVRRDEDDISDLRVKESEKPSSLCSTCGKLKPCVFWEGFSASNAQDKSVATVFAWAHGNLCRCGDEDDNRVEPHIVTVKGNPDVAYVHKLEHLLLSCADFMEKPSIAGDVGNAYAHSLTKTIRALFEDEGTP